jgi:hypothetical protein
MNISIKGYGENIATFGTQGIVCVSHTVRMTDNLTVGPCEEGDSFAGVAVNVKNGYAGVQLAGCVSVTYTGNAPVPGFCSLVADGKGGVTVDENGRDYLVVSVDTAKSVAEIIL